MNEPINYTYQRTPEYICNLNQYEIASNLDKMPTQAFYLLATAILIMTIYIYYPRIEEYYRLDKMIMPIYLMTISATWLLMFRTFNITQEIFKHKILPFIIIICAIGIIGAIYIHRDKIKNFKLEWEK